jgi:hypothetical protein
MKSASKYLKNAYLNLLDGAITYNGSAVPVYDKESDPTGNDYFIVVSTINDVDLANKSAFFSETQVTIDVITRVPNTMLRVSDAVDSITEKILQLVLPSINTTGLADDSDFHVKLVRKDSMNDFPLSDSGTKKIVRRIIKFSQTVKEK